MYNRYYQWFFLDITIILNIYSLYLLYNWDNFIININQFIIFNFFKTTLFNIIINNKNN